MLEELNPHLTPWSKAQPNNVAGYGQIGKPGHGSNIRWQTRSAVPTRFENALGDALENAYQSGAATCEEIVASFNKHNFMQGNGLPWTVTTLEELMRTLGE